MKKLNLYSLVAVFALLLSLLFFGFSGKTKTQHKKFNNNIINLSQPEPWESIGPYNLSGRMLSVDVAPSNIDLLYAGSASGGLWRGSSSSDDSWERVNIGFPVNSISAIAIHPRDENIIYIGTGEIHKYQVDGKGIVNQKHRGSFGIGIIKTSDGGVTWTKSLDWKKTDKRAIKRIEFNPLNPNTIFATSSEGVYKSTNAGLTWEHVLPVIMAQDIVMSKNDTSKVIVSCGTLNSPGKGIYYTFDTGKTWVRNTKIPDFSGKIGLTFFETDDIPIFFASIADSNIGIALLKSEKYGARWETVVTRDLVGDQGWYSNSVYVYPNDQNRFLFFGNLLYISLNSGLNISGIPGVRFGFHDYVADPELPTRIYFASDGGIYKGLPNFLIEKHSNGLNTVQFNKGISTSPSNSNLILGGSQSNGTLSYWSGLWWTPIYPFFSYDPINRVDTGGPTAINPINNDTYLTYNDNQIYLNLKADYDQGLYGESIFISPLVMSKSDPDVVYTATNYVFKIDQDSSIWRVTNNDTPLNGASITTLAVSESNADFVLAATAPDSIPTQVFKTENGGQSWTEITADLPNKLVMDFEINPQNSDSIFVVFDGYDYQHVFASSDGGLGWIDISGNLPNEPALSILLNPLKPDIIYVGTDIGVFSSVDGGLSWQPFMDGLENPVSAIELTFSEANRRIILGSHGNGAYQTRPLYQPEIFLRSKIKQISSTRLHTVDDTISLALIIENLGINNADTINTSLSLFDSSGALIIKSNKDMCCLEPDKPTELILENKYIPPGKGKYTAEFSYPSPFNDKKEVSSISFEIISPSILKADVEKKFKPFREIDSPRKIRNLPGTLDLPFNFIFDGISYNQIRVNEDGWLEFGIDSVENEFGLSPALTQVSSATLTNTSLPNKVLSPWWEALATSQNIIGVKADVSFITENLSPNRVFIIQWLRMETTGGTTLLNFQVKLYEKDNHIEFCYGERIEGIYNGPGAIIGIKDHIGGAYRFLDFTKNSYLAAEDLPIKRSPIDQWPGPDSAFVIRTRTSFDDEWNVPSGIVLRQPFPNPFNSTINISYKLEENKLSRVQIIVYDILGRKVKTLVDERQTDGNKQIVWDGFNDLGNGVASGIYIIEMQSRKKRFHKKAVLIR